MLLNSIVITDESLYVLNFLSLYTSSPHCMCLWWYITIRRMKWCWCRTLAWLKAHIGKHVPAVMTYSFDNFFSVGLTIKLDQYFLFWGYLGGKSRRDRAAARKMNKSQHERCLNTSIRSESSLFDGAERMSHLLELQKADFLNSSLGHFRRPQTTSQLERATSVFVLQYLVVMQESLHNLTSEPVREKGSFKCLVH